MNGSPAVLTYAACGFLIVVYASGRFNTPPSNRSSTRQTLYWWSCVGYVLSALALFAALSILLQTAAWRTALLGPVQRAVAACSTDRHLGDDDAAAVDPVAEATGRVVPLDLSRMG